MKKPVTKIAIAVVVSAVVIIILMMLQKTPQGPGLTAEQKAANEAAGQPGINYEFRGPNDGALVDSKPSNN